MIRRLAILATLVLAISAPVASTTRTTRETFPLR
jgi:hypothetical protein